jgi:hypothetical protein
MATGKDKGIVQHKHRRNIQMTREMILGIVRHVLTLAGGAYVAKGQIDASTLDVAIGAVVSLSGVAWSLADKVKRK